VVTQAKGVDGSLNVTNDRATIDLLLVGERVRQIELVTADDIVPHD
jgi:hypothetical protein